MTVETELYELLGVSPDASESDIKKAYRLKNRNDPTASQKFQEIAAAYEILSDSDSRALYDAAGMAGLTGGMSDGPMDPADLFGFFEASNLFGFDFAGGGAPRRKTKGQDSVVPYEVTMEDLYNWQKDVVCTTCKGSGARGSAKPKTCWTYIQTAITCTYKTRWVGNRFGTARSTCHDCEGVGEKLREKDRCKKCKGEKVVSEKGRQEIFIEKGMSPSQRIVLAGAGDQEPGLPAGDVVFVLKSKPHETFERAGNDLLTHTTITLSEALLGFSRVLITHLDGRGIKVSSPPRKIIKPDDTIVIRGEGMPVYKNADTKGDLYIIFKIEMPDSTWLRRVDQEALARLLPPKKEELDPLPAIVDDASFEESDLSNVKARAFAPGQNFFDDLDDDEENWVDEG
ncbi:DnaJ C terminal domain-containing protein [Flagelloscypha sp. PMI_526]|nr:DnaJ C terminal domain-containing protein [Flagelloscypha sp. PMI_526]